MTFQRLEKGDKVDKPFDIADLSSNKYAASMRELAEGLGGWSGIFLPLFYLYQIKTLENAHFFSWKTLVLVLGGELIFVLAWKFANIVLAFIAALLITPVINSGRLVMAKIFRIPGWRYLDYWFA